MINHLGSKKNRRLRPGTSLEMIQFWKQNSSMCPEFFTSLKSTWNDTVIGWFGESKEFEILSVAGDWRRQYQIFMVEEMIKKL